MFHLPKMNELLVLTVLCIETRVVHSTLNLRSTLYVSTSWNEWNCGFRLPIYISWKCSIALCIWDLYSWNYEEAGCCHKTPFSSLGTTMEKNEWNEWKTTEFLVSSDLLSKKIFKSHLAHLAVKTTEYWFFEITKQKNIYITLVWVCSKNDGISVFLSITVCIRDSNTIVLWHSKQSRRVQNGSVT